MAAFDRNGINTLFVSGLPEDVKAREIHNLFRRRPGFDFCQLKYTGRGNQVVAFATFFDHQATMAAMHSLNGVKFDPQTGSTLHIELARSNSRRKHKRGNGVYVVIDERTKQGNAQENSSDDGDSSDSDVARERGNVDYVEEVAGDPESTANVSDINYFHPKLYRLFHQDFEWMYLPQEDQPEKRTRDGDTPCSTVFIANLGPNCTEEELKQALVQCESFLNQGGMPVAFADFEVTMRRASLIRKFSQTLTSVVNYTVSSSVCAPEIEQATNVMEDLQGATLPSSDRGACT
ncbi:unnamed protein product [Linum trigynum]|uniref:RRM domain-containing protein n=1 Tax=Linum trigynum TaxID=586398 RepID=A0AAV2CW46_9ROSI